MTQHKHRAIPNKQRGPFGFQFCISPRRCNPASHGGVMFVDICSCGAERHRNSTGNGHTEYGRWVEAAK